MRRFRAGAGLLAVALLTAACGRVGGAVRAGSSPEPASATLAERVCAAVPREQLLRVARGTRLDRSGDVQFIAREPNFVDGGLTHAGPWDYVQDVPLLLYGPGYVRPGVYRRPVTLADVAPTVGALLRFPFDAPDGRALVEALLPDRPLPKLVVVVVWDSGGRDVLDRWPDAWPYLRSLARRGAWFEHATVGASPSNTPTGHATIGTGAFPDRNGFVDEFIRVNGRLQKPNENGPGFLLVPTLADLYDRARGNRPLVGAIATLSAHVMMMSHGRMWGGGDADSAVTREKEDAETGGAESVTWNAGPPAAHGLRGCRPALAESPGRVLAACRSDAYPHGEPFRPPSGRGQGRSGNRVTWIASDGDGRSAPGLSLQACSSAATLAESLEPSPRQPGRRGDP